MGKGYIPGWHEINVPEFLQFPEYFKVILCYFGKLRNTEGWTASGNISP
jgi:hypothetical protein